MFLSCLNIFNPERFQGRLNKQHYFEGWYFKFVSAKGEKCAFIPGISLTKEDAHCFIQYINGDTGKTVYIRYDINEFEYSKSTFWIRIGKSVFSSDYVEIEIDKDGFKARGRVQHSNVQKLPKSLFSPGIMGWYSFMPFMQCYHGLVSMDHTLNGELIINGSLLQLNSGKGYIEKDWGTSFPRSWIWLQCNNFEGQISSFMFSLAKIPWLGQEFDGFLCVVLYKGQFLRFATYTGARIQSIRYKGAIVEISLRDKSYELTIRVQRDKTGHLAAPVFGQMNRTIHESIDAKIELEVRDLKSSKILRDKGRFAGCELVGDTDFKMR